MWTYTRILHTMLSVGDEAHLWFAIESACSSTDSRKPAAYNPFKSELQGLCPPEHS